MSAPSEFPKHVEAARMVLEELAPAFSTAQAEEIAQRVSSFSLTRIT